MKQKTFIFLVIFSAVGHESAYAQGLEIPAKRTWNSKTYLNTDDNTVTVEISSGYWHYRDREGNFQEIDRRILPAPDNTRYEVTRGLYQAAFSFNLSDAKYPIDFELPDKTRFRAKPASLAYYSRSSKQLVIIQEAQSTSGVVAENKIRYPEIFTGVDMEYEYGDATLKQLVHLSQKARDNLPAPETLGLNPNNTDLVLVARIEVPDSLEAFAKNQRISSQGPGNRIRLEYEGDGHVVFRNAAGKNKFFLPSNFAFASAGHDSASEESSSRRMWRRFSNDGLDNFMITGIELKWLNKQPAGTVVLDPSVSLTPPTDDVWIEYNKYDNFNAYTQIRIGRGDSYGWKRSLVRFDLSAIPSTAVVQSASLQLYFYGKFGANTINRSIQCHQVLKPWTAGFVSWFYQNGETLLPWATAGVGFNGVDAKTTPEATVSWHNEYPSWKTYNLATLAQQWINGTAGNYGVILWATDEDDYTNGDEKWIYSSEYTGDITKRPKLVVTYTVNPLIDITYDALNRPTTIAYANGVTETNQYDVNRGWLTRRDYQKSGTNIYYFNSTLSTDFDKAGNLKRVEYKHKTDAAQTMTYAYNRLYRLTNFTPSGGSAKTYSYDPTGLTMSS